MLSGLLAPSFSSFWYYYNRGIKGFRQLFIGLTTVLSWLTLFAGVVVFSRYFSRWEWRNLFMMSYLINMLGCVLKVLYVAETYEAIHMDVHVFYCI